MAKMLPVFAIFFCPHIAHEHYTTTLGSCGLLRPSLSLLAFFRALSSAVSFNNITRLLKPVIFQSGPWNILFQFRLKVVFGNSFRRPPTNRFGLFEHAG
jgi:hypothetical protein